MHEAKNSKNQPPLDILAYNSTNKPCFQNPTKNFLTRGENVQKLLILAGFASYVASIVNQGVTLEPL